jgi:hypothetical protein
MPVAFSVWGSTGILVRQLNEAIHLHFQELFYTEGTAGYTDYPIHKEQPVAV